MTKPMLGLYPKRRRYLATPWGLNTLGPGGSDDRKLGFVSKTMNTWMGAMPENAMSAGFKDMQGRAMDIAMENAESAFTFAGKISSAQTFQDIATLQTQFVQDRMQAFATQTQQLQKLIGETLQKLQRG